MEQMRTHKNITQIADRVVNGRWMLNEDTFEVLAKRVDARLVSDNNIINRFASVVSSLLKTKASVDDFDNAALAEETNSGQQYVAVIPVCGVLMKGVNEDDEKELGLCNTDRISEALDEAIADTSVSEIILAFSSPGGEVIGIEVLARKIGALSSIKPIYGWCETECASAAYWLMSQCSAICMAPDAQIGNVGARTSLAYYANGVDKDGRTIEQFSAGKYKLLGTKFRPPTEEERNLINEDIVNTYTKFKAAVTSKRSIKDDDLQGLLYEGDKAITLGYADSTSDSITDYLNNKETSMSKNFTKVAVAVAETPKVVAEAVTYKPVFPEVPESLAIKAESEPEHKEDDSKPEKKADEQSEPEMKRAKMGADSYVACPHCSKTFGVDPHEEEKQAEDTKEDSKPEKAESSDKEEKKEAIAETPKVEATAQRFEFTMGELFGLRPKATKSKFHEMIDTAVDERLKH
jgi:capsid assembly protease